MQDIMSLQHFQACHEMQATNESRKPDDKFAKPDSKFNVFAVIIPKHAVKFGRCMRNPYILTQ
jgi:hypothetical protein